MTSSYVKDKHDIGILRQDSSTKVGLMLRRARNEIPAYQVFDDEYLAQQFFTGDAGYNNLPPEKELIIRQDDWRSGFGIETYDANDPKRYFSSIGMDMRFRGKAIAGPIATAIADIPGNDVLPTGFVDSGAGWTTETLAYDNNTATGAVSGNIAFGGSSTTYLELSIASMTCWGARWYIVRNTGSAAADVVDVDLYYSAGWHNIYSSVLASGEWVGQGITTPQAVTAMRIRITNNDGADNTTYDIREGHFNGKNGIIVDAINFNNVLYFAAGNSLVKLNVTGDGLTMVKIFPDTITDLEIFSDSKLYIALGFTYPYWEMTTAEAFTKNTLAVNKIKYFAFVRTTVDTMYGSDAVNKIRSTINPANGGTAWSGQTTVDSTVFAINQLFSSSGALYIRKENRPYYLNSSGTVKDDLAPELESLSRSIASQNIIEWLGKLYIPWGDQMLLEEDAGVLTWRNPADFATGLSDFNGKVFAVAADDRYAYAILDNSTKIEVLAGRLEEIDGSIVWVWHPINETTLTGCQTCYISTVYQKRLWISSTSSSDSLYYIPLPLGYADVVNDTNRSFLTGTTMETSWLHANFKSTTKAFISLELVMGHTYNAGRYFTVKYKKLGDSSWTTIGNYTGSATSMTQSRFIPVDGSSNNPKSTMFKLQFTAVTDDVTITPVMLSYHLKAILYPSQREIISCKVYCSNEIQLKDGTTDRGSYDTIIATLDEARAATWPVTIYDLDGVTKTVKLLPLQSNVPRWTLTSNEKERKFEKEYNLLMEIVALS